MMDIDSTTGNMVLAGNTNRTAYTWIYSAHGTTNPSPPLDLGATPGNGQASLGWNPPASKGGRTLIGYNVYVGTSPGGGTSIPANSSPITSLRYTETGLINGVTYYFVVNATNIAGASAPSNEASATPLPRPQDHLRRSEQRAARGRPDRGHHRIRIHKRDISQLRHHPRRFYHHQPHPNQFHYPGAPERADLRPSDHPLRHQQDGPGRQIHLVSRF
jgi:hypothetical protein